MEEKKLTMIPVSEIYSHPGNPRKEIGDVSELADNIKAKGILQNLTVVPGHLLTQEEYKALADDYRKEPTDEKRDILNSRKSPEGYTLIIGHRRYAASCLAGLLAVPCAIVEMDDKEQFETMMIENMARVDLTSYEQAEGFQIMLDFGETIETIAEKTGFSDSTIRRRVKLLELDKEEFKQAEERGATLSDYIELDKITDPELKNQCLKAVGTNNFKNKIHTAEREISKREYLDSIVFEVSKFATEIKGEERNNYECQTTYYEWNRKKVEVPTDDIKYFFIRGYSQVEIFVEKNENTPSDAELAEKARQEALKAEKEASREKLREITNRHYSLRKDFIKNYSHRKGTLVKSEMQKIIFECLTAVSFRIFDGRYETIELNKDFYNINGLQYNPDDKIANFSKMQEIAEGDYISYIVKTVYFTLEDEMQKFWLDHWDAEKGEYLSSFYDNERLHQCYRMLTVLGYQMSDEEIEMSEGRCEFLEVKSDKNSKFAEVDSIDVECDDIDDDLDYYGARETDFYSDEELAAMGVERDEN